MKYTPALQSATLLRRHKRFLADVALPDGRRTTIHCPNTGSMLGCAEPGWTVWMSTSDNPKRKYAHTWELVERDDGVLIGVNTGLSNRLVGEAIEQGTIEPLAGYDSIRREVVVEAGSRMDFVLEGAGRRRCVVEVKNVSAAVEGGVAFFPDAVSIRAQRHLEVLGRCLDAGDRAVLMYCVQRGDVAEVRPADHIDATYGAMLREARDAGVEMYAYVASPTPDEVRLERAVPVVCAAPDVI